MLKTLRCNVCCLLVLDPLALDSDDNPGLQDAGVFAGTATATNT